MQLSLTTPEGAVSEADSYFTTEMTTLHGVSTKSENFELYKTAPSTTTSSDGDVKPTEASETYPVSENTLVSVNPTEAAMKSQGNALQGVVVVPSASSRVIRVSVRLSNNSHQTEQETFETVTESSPENDSQTDVSTDFDDVASASVGNAETSEEYKPGSQHQYRPGSVSVQRKDLEIAVLNRRNIKPQLLRINEKTSILFAREGDLYLKKTTEESPATISSEEVSLPPETSSTETTTVPETTQLESLATTLPPALPGKGGGLVIRLNGGDTDDSTVEAGVTERSPRPRMIMLPMIFRFYADRARRFAADKSRRSDTAFVEGAAREDIETQVLPLGRAQ